MGADELALRFLNSIKDGISYPLTLLFQKIMQDEEVPDDWHEANIVPVFMGGDRVNHVLQIYWCSWTG